jgi:ubiquinone biosynthesis protein
MLQTKLGKNTVNAVRLAEVLQVFIRHGFADVLNRVGFYDGLPARVLRGINLMEPAQKAVPSTIGQRLAAAFVELGPTFVKFGQILSTRPDLLGNTIAQELSRLQDQVDPLPFEKMSAVIEEELGSPINELFAFFDQRPVASASVSQVYKAQLTTGEDVAVKVQRPGAAKIIESDLSLMRQVAEWIAEHVDDAGWADPPGIVDEFARSVRRELDFGIEARVIEQFRRNFDDTDYVEIPEVYLDYSATRVLTMAWIDGVRVDRLEAYASRRCDPHIVAYQGCQVLCRMVFEHHLFHADPHPGNVFITEDNGMAFLDLGMAGHLERTDVAAIADLFLAIFHQDAAECVNALLNLTVSGDPVDSDLLEHEIAEFIAFEAEAIINSGEVARGLERATQILHRYNLQLAPRFSLLLKGLATIEMVGKTLDPDLDFVPILEPYVKKLITDRYNPAQMMKDAQANASTFLKLSRQIPYDAAAILQMVRKGKLRMQIQHEQMENLASVIDRSSNRSALAVIIAALIIGSSMIVTAEGAISGLGVAGFTAAGLLGVWLIVSILMSKRF